MFPGEPREKPTIAHSGSPEKRDKRARRCRTFVDTPVETSYEDLRAGCAHSWVEDARVFDHGGCSCTRAASAKDYDRRDDEDVHIHEYASKIRSDIQS
jgi:hypothetical protein